MEGFIAAIIALAVTAFITGLIHSSRPDHLVAVSTLVVEYRDDKPISLGVRWGLSHTSGVFILGIAALLGEAIFDISRASTFSKMSVGFVLVALGIRVLFPLVSGRVQLSTHIHKGAGDSREGIRHVHFYQKRKHLHSQAESIGVSLIHGFAGNESFVGYYSGSGSLNIICLDLSCVLRIRNNRRHGSFSRVMEMFRSFENGNSIRVAGEIGDWAGGKLYWVYLACWWSSFPAVSY